MILLMTECEENTSICYLVGWICTLENIHKSCNYPGPDTGGEGGLPQCPLFETWNPHHWIGNFVLPQKYVKNFAVAQKLWILRPFFKIFLLRKQLLIKIIKTFKNSDLYMNYSIFYTKHTYKWILLFHYVMVFTTIFDNVAKRIHTFSV